MHKFKTKNVFSVAEQMRGVGHVTLHGNSQVNITDAHFGTPGQEMPTLLPLRGSLGVVRGAHVHILFLFAAATRRLYIIKQCAWHGTVSHTYGNTQVTLC